MTNFFSSRYFDFLFAHFRITLTRALSDSVNLESMVTHWASCARVAPVASIEQHAWIRRSARDVQVDGEMRTTDLPVATKFHQDFSQSMEHSQLVNEALLAQESTIHRSNAPRERTLIALDPCHVFRVLLASFPAPLEV